MRDLSLNEKQARDEYLDALVQFVASAAAGNQNVALNLREADKKRDRQRIERYLAKDPFLKSVSWLYDVASHYGSSVPRAFASFIWWNAGFGVLYVLLRAVYSLKLNTLHPDYWWGLAPSTFRIANGHELTEIPGVTLALQNAVNPLSLFSDKGVVTVHTIWGQVLSIVQVAGSLSLLALFLLALRSRFQRSGSGGGSS